MYRAEIYGKIVAIAVEVLGVEEGRVTRDATWDDLGADSLDQAEIEIEIEALMDIGADLLDIAGSATIGETVDLVATMMSEAGHLVDGKR